MQESDGNQHPGGAAVTGEILPAAKLSVAGVSSRSVYAAWKNRAAVIELGEMGMRRILTGWVIPPRQTQAFPRIAVRLQPLLCFPGDFCWSQTCRFILGNF